MRWSLCVLTLLALAPKPSEAAEKVRVAVAKVGARKTARPDKLESGIRAGVQASGAQPIAAAALAKAARDVGVKADSPEGARAAGADYLVKVTMSVKKKKFLAAAELIRASDGEVVERAERGYSAGKAALAAGKAIGKILGKRAKDLGRPDGAVASGDTPPPPPPSKVFAPAEDPKEEETADAAPPRSIEPKDEDESASVSAEIEKPSKSRSGREDGILRFGIAGGTQIASAYTVAVDGDATGLAYSLTPLFLVNANLLVRIPQIGLFFGGRVDFAPVKYEIDVVPAVDPSDPSGRFLSAGGHIGYEINLDLASSARLRLSPLVAFGWDSLTVDSQGDNTVVVSWGAINAGGGVSVNLILVDSLAIELEGRGGYVFSYSEKPKTTGDGGAGFNVLAGFAVRYWLINLFGIYLDGAYEYMQVGMDGTGSRVGFIEDPPITDATIYSADFKLGLGVMLGI